MTGAGQDHDRLGLALMAMKTRRPTGVDRDQLAGVAAFYGGEQELFAPGLDHANGVEFTCGLSHGQRSPWVAVRAPSRLVISASARRIGVGIGVLSEELAPAKALGLSHDSAFTRHTRGSPA